ncbi:MAG: KAP family NTPase, partial [Thermodesulfovibrionales bacterium]|nr:KAP family NTPase [Thermodesulfovibrionales bacterium]
MEGEKNIKFKFLSDKPLKEESELLHIEFGHKELGTTLSKIVENVEAPFTIGLFGKWGTGKSSLSFLLRNVLKRKNIPVVIFDVWKHEKDALRRTFLREIARQLDNAKAIEENFQLNERLD